MLLHINGEAREVAPGLTLGGLIEQLGMKADRVAVELNHDIVPRERWPETELHDRDRLEIVHFVGGGGPHYKRPINEFRAGSSSRCAGPPWSPAFPSPSRTIPRPSVVNVFPLTRNNSRLKCFKHFLLRMF